jgi:hypothetical protein
MTAALVLAATLLGQVTMTPWGPVSTTRNYADMPGPPMPNVTGLPGGSVSQYAAWGFHSPYAPKTATLSGPLASPNGYVYDSTGWPTGFRHPLYQWGTYHRSERLAQQGWGAERIHDDRDPVRDFDSQAYGPGSPPPVIWGERR